MLACLPARLGELPTRVARFDHQALVDAAARHGVSAFVADALAAAQVTLEPPAQATLSQGARALIAQGLKHKRLTLKVVNALHAEGITPVLLKGAGLAQRLYPEQPLGRPASDVDVLVTPAELPAARKAMARLGLAERVDPSLDDVFEEHHHLAFAATGELVEVHFRLFSGFGGNAFDDAAIRARLLAGSFEGRPVRWLGPEDEFVYLATHAANHAFLRASWLLDLERFIARRADLDWATMAARCRGAGFTAAVTASLWVLESALEVSLPAQARVAFPVSLSRALGHGLLFSPAHLEAADLSAHRVGGFALRLWLVDSPRHGVRHAVDGARRLIRQLRAHAD